MLTLLGLSSGEAAFYNKDIATGGASGGSISISAKQLHISGKYMEYSEVCPYLCLAVVHLGLGRTVFRFKYFSVSISIYNFI